jgi:hypothetical protein
MPRQEEQLKRFQAEPVRVLRSMAAAKVPAFFSWSIPLLRLVDQSLVLGSHSESDLQVV